MNQSKWPLLILDCVGTWFKLHVRLVENFHLLLTSYKFSSYNLQSLYFLTVFPWFSKLQKGSEIKNRQRNNWKFHLQPSNDQDISKFTWWSTYRAWKSYLPRWNSKNVQSHFFIPPTELESFPDLQRQDDATIVEL